MQSGRKLGPGALLYPEALVRRSATTPRQGESLAVATPRE